MAVTPRPTTTSGWGADSARWDRFRSPRLLSIFAIATVLTQGGIAVTGATVRVTGSGLGCPTWPNCHAGSLVPVNRGDGTSMHQLIEFGNRTLTGVVLAASLGLFLLVLISPRRDLRRLAILLPLGVLLQALVGGVTVLAGLAWYTVAPHMLISLGLLYVAVQVQQGLKHPTVTNGRPLPRPLQLLALGGLLSLTALSIVGTLVTAAGPHAGDKDTPRLEWSVQVLAQVHADLMFLYLGLLLGLLVAVMLVKAAAGLRRRVWVLIGVTLAQGTIGLVQYAIGVPEVLVVLHVAGAVIVVGVASWVLWAVRQPVKDSVST